MGNLTSRDNNCGMIHNKLYFGKYEEYFINNGKKEGECKIYNSDGTLNIIETYTDGKIISKQVMVSYKPYRGRTMG